MKKIILSAFVTFFILLSAAEAQAQFSAGAGVLYGFELERVGIRADGVYSINETFRAAADFGYYFPETVEESFLNYTATWKYWEFNANVHYLFVNNEEWNVYGIAGINYLKFNHSESYDPPGNMVSTDGIRSVAAKGISDIIHLPSEMVSYGATNPNSEYSASETGLNLGIGGEYKISFGSVFGELKYAGIGGDADQLVLGAGVRYSF